MKNIKLGAPGCIDYPLFIFIILILVAIALPNFFESSTRGLVKHINRDMTDIANALEEYYKDHQDYPPSSLTNNIITRHSEFTGESRDGREERPVTFAGYQLTTPVAYLKALPRDRIADYIFYTYSYYKPSDRDQWILWSCGVDCSYQLDASNIESYYNSWTSTGTLQLQIDAIKPLQYDPTNGTISFGEIIMIGGKGL